MVLNKGTKTRIGVRAHIVYVKREEGLCNVTCLENVGGKTSVVFLVLKRATAVLRLLYRVTWVERYSHVDHNAYNWTPLLS